MELMVGCPVYRRDWILPDWFSHVEEACSRVGLTPTYAFALDLRDETTHACIEANVDMRGRTLFLKPLHEDVDREEKRLWDSNRIGQMVSYRNSLLRMVRRYRPDRFLSLDSDILLHPDALGLLMEHSDEYAAVGGKVYLAKSGTACPSYAHLVHGRMNRGKDVQYPRRADVLMAFKLMRPCAYDIDYRYHASGEDIGWSQAIKEAGLKMLFDGRIASKHVWDKDHLGKFDKRVGY